MMLAAAAAVSLVAIVVVVAAAAAVVLTAAAAVVVAAVVVVDAATVSVPLSRKLGRAWVLVDAAIAFAPSSAAGALSAIASLLPSHAD
jgi:hypothetical protein